MHQIERSSSCPPHQTFNSRTTKEMHRERFFNQLVFFNYKKENIFTIESNKQSNKAILITVKLAKNDILTIRAINFRDPLGRSYPVKQI